MNRILSLLVALTLFAAPAWADVAIEKDDTFPSTTSISTKHENQGPWRIVMLDRDEDIITGTFYITSVKPMAFDKTKNAVFTIDGVNLPAKLITAKKTVMTDYSLAAGQFDLSPLKDKFISAKKITVTCFFNTGQVVAWEVAPEVIEDWRVVFLLPDGGSHAKPKGQAPANKPAPKPEPAKPGAPAKPATKAVPAQPAPTTPPATKTPVPSTAPAGQAPKESRTQTPAPSQTPPGPAPKPAAPPQQEKPQLADPAKQPPAEPAKPAQTSPMAAPASTQQQPAAPAAAPAAESKPAAPPEEKTEVPAKEKPAETKPVETKPIAAAPPAPPAPEQAVPATPPPRPLWQPHAPQPAPEAKQQQKEPSAPVTGAVQSFEDDDDEPSSAAGAKTAPKQPPATGEKK